MLIVLNNLLRNRVNLINKTWFIGRRLKINIYSSQGSLLLPDNIILNAHHLDLLNQHGKDIHEEDTQLVTEFILETTVSELQSIYEKIHKHSDELSKEVIQDELVSKIEQLSINNLPSVIMELCKKDNYTYRHCIGVAIISYLIGKWLGLKDEEMHDLAIAGLLHDLGKIKIPDPILNKVSSLTADEYAEIKLHTHYGYEMIRNISGMSEQYALVALQHHEREDGSGYPYGISGMQITPFSKIVAVADVFHTMISERVYKKPVPLYQVFQEIYQRAYGLFDPHIVRTFISSMMNRLIGDSVILTNGQIARIVMLHPDDLINPLVEVKGKFHDLRNTESKIMDFASSR